MTYISSISAGVRRATSGRMNQAMITTTAPVPAKLQCRRRDVSFFLLMISFFAVGERKRSCILQETSLNAPFMGRCATSPVDHKRCAKAEHNAYEIR